VADGGGGRDGLEGDLRVQGSGCAMESRAGAPGGLEWRERMSERSFLDSESPTRAPCAKLN
jgi:hypothetical protein